LIIFRGNSNFSSVDKVNFSEFASEKSSTTDLWLIDTSSDLHKLVISVFFAVVSLDLGEFTAEETAGRNTLPEIELSTNSASWKIVCCKPGTEPCFLLHVEVSAVSLGDWDSWADLNSLLVDNPSAVFVSPPFASVEFVDETTMMPVAFVPRPSSGGESTL
jgi:hypothetical protein